MMIPKQTCWMLRKIMKSRQLWDHDQDLDISFKKIIRLKHFHYLDIRLEPHENKPCVVFRQGKKQCS